MNLDILDLGLICRVWLDCLIFWYIQLNCVFQTKLFQIAIPTQLLTYFSVQVDTFIIQNHYLS